MAFGLHIRKNYRIAVMILEIFFILFGVGMLKLYFTKRSLKKRLVNVPTVRNEWPIIGHGHRFAFKNTKRK